MIYALRDCLAGTGYGYCTFRRIRQHLGSDLNGGASYLPNFFDLGTTLADQGAALRSGDNQSECDGRPRYTTATSGTATRNVVELRAPLLELLAYQRERLEDRVRRPGDSHYPFRTGTVGDIDFRAGLRWANGKKVLPIMGLHIICTCIKLFSASNIR